MVENNRFFPRALCIKAKDRGRDPLSFRTAEPRFGNLEHLAVRLLVRGQRRWRHSANRCFPVGLVVGVFRSGGSRSLIALALAAPILAFIGLIGGSSSLSLGVGLSVGLVVRFVFAVGVLQAMPVLTSKSIWLAPSVIAVVAVFALLLLGHAITAEDVGSAAPAAPVEISTGLTTANGNQG